MFVKKISNFVTLAFFLIAVFGLIANPQLSFAEISVDSYCQLTIQSLEQQIPQTQELISIVNQYKDNPETLNQQLQIKRTEYDSAKEALYSSFDTTAEEYVNYMSKNGAKAVSYTHLTLPTN